VTYSGFNADTPAHPGHVFVSRDLGRTWVNLSRHLPDWPFSDVLENPSNQHLYAASDVGLFVSRDRGATWRRIDQGLPHAPVLQMQLDKPRQMLVVATFGRGVWERRAP
jgi:photosystem II stability/assembly factor-like uncharacterized protein